MCERASVERGCEPDETMFLGIFMHVNVAIRRVSNYIEYEGLDEKVQPAGVLKHTDMEQHG